MPSYLELPYAIDPKNPFLLDTRSGPWASLAAAKAGIPVETRVKGLLVFVQNAEFLYVFRNGTADTDLIPAISWDQINGSTPIWNQNTTGNAATATLADNSTRWAGQQYQGGTVNPFTYVMVYDSTTNMWASATLEQVKDFLSLGTAAFEDLEFFATAAQGGKADSAFGWGNHASAGYFLAANFNSSFDTRLALKSTSNLAEGTNLYYTDARVQAFGDTQWVQLDGAYGNPAWLTQLAWNKITGTPTTIGGYGITDAYTKSQIDDFFSGATAIAGYSKNNWDTAYGWGNHASAGYLTTIAGIAAGGELAGTYANPTLVNSAVTGKLLSGVNITGGTISATDSILVAFGKVQNQINSLMGGVQFVDFWNATTDTPTLPSAVGNKGKYYIVQVAGPGYDVGDWIVSNGISWGKIDNTDAVISVNGFTGAVSLTTTHITEGTRLYFTDSRVWNALALTTTGSSGAATYNAGTGVFNIPNYTLAGLGGEPAIAAGTTGQFWRGDKTWQALTTSVVAEGSRLYFTDARVWTAMSWVAGTGNYNVANGVMTIPTHTSHLTNNSGFITDAQSYYIGTTLNALNRASGAQTLAGVSIDGTAAYATNWGGFQADFNVVASSFDYIAVRDIAAGKFKVGSAASVASFLSGQTMNIVGNASTATLAANSTKWAGFDYTGVISTTPLYAMMYNSATSDWRPIGASGLATFLSGQTMNIVGNASTATNVAATGVTSGHALGLIDDTNVTLSQTNSGVPALLTAKTITVGWTGTLADSRIASASNWNTAYSWGNHAGLYLSLSGGTVNGRTLFVRTGQTAYTNAALEVYTSDGGETGISFHRGGSSAGFLSHGSYGGLRWNGDQLILESNVSEAATASKIVRRDSNGRIYTSDVLWFNTSSIYIQNGGTSGWYFANTGGAYGYLKTTAFTSMSTTPTANSVVQRDGSGYVEAVYFRTTNTGTQGSGLGAITGKTTSGDNYLYEFNAAAVRAFLSLPSVNDDLQAVTARGASTNVATYFNNGVYTTNVGVAEMSLTSNQLYRNSANEMYLNYSGTGQTIIGNSAGITLNASTIVGGTISISGSISGNNVNLYLSEYLRSAVTVAGAAQYQTWFNSAGTRRGYFGFGGTSSNTITLANETGGSIVLEGNSTVSGTFTATGDINTVANAYFGNYVFLNSKLALRGTDTYLRLNQNGEFADGVYTPYNLRTDGVTYFGGTTYYISGSAANLPTLNSPSSITSNGTGLFVAQYADINLNGARGFKSVNTAIGGETWTIAAGRVGVTNAGFAIRNVTTDLDALYFNSAREATFFNNILANNNVIMQGLAKKLITYNAGSYEIEAIQASYFGYSSSYAVLQVGDTRANKSIAFGVDLTGNPAGSFNGTGLEYIWKNVGKFITPNASNNGYNTLFDWNNVGQVTFGNNATVIGSDRVLTLKGAGGGANSLLRYSDGSTAKFSTGFNGGNYIIYDDVNGAYRATIGTTGSTFNGAFNVNGGRTTLTHTQVGVSYTQSTLEVYSDGTWGPRISFHYGGVVASQIGIEGSGRIAILNNPGTGYENLIAANAEFVGDVTLSTGANRTVQIGSSTNYFWRLKAAGDNFRINMGADALTAVEFTYPNGTAVFAWEVQASYFRGKSSYEILFNSSANANLMHHDASNLYVAGNIYVAGNGWNTGNLLATQGWVNGAYQPLENQRLSTSNSVNFSAVTLSGGTAVNANQIYLPTSSAFHVNYSGGGQTHVGNTSGGVYFYGNTDFNNYSIGNVLGVTASNVYAGTVYSNTIRNTATEAILSHSSNITYVGGGASAHSLAFYAGAQNRMQLSTGGSLVQGTTVVYPNAKWGASSGTGPVVIKIPGGSSNYGMIHMTIAIYEYNSNAASTITVGGHNWSSGWYNTSVNVEGYTNKQVRLGFKDGQYCVVIGDASSTWSYGQVVVMRVQNGEYYSGSIDLGGTWSVALGSDSYTAISGDLRTFRTPNNMFLMDNVMKIGQDDSYGTAYNAIGFSGGATTNAHNKIFAHASSGAGLFINAATGHNVYLRSGGSEIGYGNTSNWHFPQTTDATSSSSGALTTAGGISAQKNIFSGAGIYAGNWFYNSGTTGLYNSTNGGYFYNGVSSYWSLTSSSGLAFRAGYETTPKGYVYHDGTGFGLLNAAGGWAVRTNGASGQELHGNWAVSGTLDVTGKITGTAGGQDSDERLKDFHDFDALSIANTVRLRNYTWKDARKGTEHRYGYSAQAIQQVLPEAVYEVTRDGQTTLAVEYEMVHSVIIDEHTRRIQELEKRVKELEHELGK